MEQAISPWIPPEGERRRRLVSSNSEPLLLLGQPDQDHLPILLRQADHMHEPRLGNHREQPDPVRL